MKGFIARLKQGRQGDLRRVGVGGPTDLAAAYFQKATGTKFQLVPSSRRCAAGTVTCWAARSISPSGKRQITWAMCAAVSSSRFAVLSKKRWWAAPDVPTMDEAGVTGLYSSFWHGLGVPKGTPKEIIAKLNAAMGRDARRRDGEKRMADIGQEVWPTWISRIQRRSPRSGRPRSSALVAGDQGRQHQGRVRTCARQ